jgi:hypothetical protein
MNTEKGYWLKKGKKIEKKIRQWPAYAGPKPGWKRSSVVLFFLFLNSYWPFHNVWFNWVNILAIINWMIKLFNQIRADNWTCFSPNLLQVKGRHPVKFVFFSKILMKSNIYHLIGYTIVFKNI